MVKKFLLNNKDRGHVSPAPFPIFTSKFYNNFKYQRLKIFSFILEFLPQIRARAQINCSLEMYKNAKNVYTPLGRRCRNADEKPALIIE